MVPRTPRCTIAWRHHIALIEKQSDRDLRLWYADQATEHGVSRNVLAHHIAIRLYERTGTAIMQLCRDPAQRATRDPYLFDKSRST